MRNTKFWSQNLKGRDHLEDLGVDEEIILALREIGGGRCSLDSYG
jgi:hypothetical protein